MSSEEPLRREQSESANIREKNFPAVIRKIEQNTVTLFSSQKPEDLPEGTAVEITIALKENTK